jgi:hypothetical protein
MTVLAYTPISAAARGFMIAAAVLVSTAGVSLFFLSENTNLYFAWTIKPPMTAAYLGTGYLTVATALLLALRERDWARVRVGVAVVATGLICILIASLLHLDKFHLNSEVTTARGWAWSWMFLYVVLVPALATVLWAQRRAPRTESAGVAALAPPLQRGMRGLAVVMIALGATLFLLPASAEYLWPWPLTPLTARMVGSFYAAIAVSLFVAARENDYTRIHVAAFAYVVGVLLQVVNAWRYPLERWLDFSGVLYALVLAAMFVIGTWGARGYLRAHGTPGAPH